MSEPYLKPLPKKQPENAPLWEGLARHEFHVPQCDDCGAWNWVPYPACRNCLSENLSWKRLSGAGTLFSYTIIHRGVGDFQKDVPYVTALVQMDTPGGSREVIVLGNVDGVAHDKLKIGMPLKMAFKDIEGEDVTLWEFTGRES
jgi:uncharacterized OB-fold protein